MGQIGSMWYNIGAKTADLEKGLANSRSKLSGLSKAFEAITGSSLLGASAFAAAGKAIQFVINEAMQAEQSEMRLTTALISTKGAAGMSKEALMEYATALSQVTVNSEETIIDAESLMLTFTKVGKEIFPQAMEAAMNLSAALGGDLQSKIIMVGKLMQDPNGMGAAKRVGISFSEAQIEMGKAMFETGNIAGYQAMVIAELNKEFGGMAKAMGTTYAGQVAIMKNNFGELAETVGKTLIPILADAAKTLNQIMTLNTYYTTSVKNATQEMQRQGVAYEEYERRLSGAASAAGKLSERHKEYYDQILNGAYTDPVWMLEVNQKLGILSESEYQAGIDVLKLKDAFDSQTRSGMIWDTSINQWIVDTSKLTGAFSELEPLVVSVTDYTKDLDTAQLAAFASAGLEADAQYRVYESLGLIDKASYYAIQAIQNWRDELANTGNIDAYIGKVELLNRLMRDSEYKSYGTSYSTPNAGGNTYTPPAISTPVVNPRFQATGGYGSGLTLVGERGPELVNLPYGSYVNNNNDSKNMVSGDKELLNAINQLNVSMSRLPMQMRDAILLA
jgi:uncharacterized protein YfbU (UPF0304 family)